MNAAEANELHVVVLDEFDAICRRRSSGTGEMEAGTAARDSVVNQLLALIDDRSSIANWTHTAAGEDRISEPQNWFVMNAPKASDYTAPVSNQAEYGYLHDGMSALFDPTRLPTTAPEDLLTADPATMWTPLISGNALDAFYISTFEGWSDPDWLTPIRDAPRHGSRIRHSSTLSIARRRDRTARSASSTASGRPASTRPLRQLRLRLFLALDRLERGEQSDLLLAKVFRRRFERVRRREGELRARTRGNCRQSPDISLKTQISCRSRRRARTVDTNAVTAVMPYRYARESSSPPIAARESRAREEWWRFLESVTVGDDAGRRRERRRRDEGLRRLRILSSYGWSSTIYVN